jgi:hypothetical protein
LVIPPGIQSRLGIEGGSEQLAERMPTASLVVKQLAYHIELLVVLLLKSFG